MWSRIGIATALTLSGLVFLAAPASAGSGTCAAYYTCTWDGTSYSGATVAMKDNNKKFSAFNLSDGQNADDRADSVSANHVTSCRSFLYEDESQGGHYI
ncbi:MAG: hypothetical protein HGA51_11615 [Demequinaceae bacterium]|nr:hypothetical protein [Demequinaceae bacterium]